jgi:hypothetical protein
MVDDLAAGCLGGLFGDFDLDRESIARRQAAKRQAKYLAGASVRMQCSLRRPRTSARWSLFGAGPLRMPQPPHFGPPHQ